LAALRTLRLLQSESREPSPDEQATLARWASWGAVPEVFDDTNARFATTRAELAMLLSDRELDAARRTTINAHYTSAEVVEAVWSVVTDLGFTTGRVLEPGCGSGNFIGFAPRGCAVTGVELDPVTAAIAAALYPEADIRTESFAETRLAPGAVDLVIGNVPFGKLTLHDPDHNAGRHSIHNHFIMKGLDLTRPGGLIAVVTSRFTLDAKADAARQAMAERADLVGAIRLPAGTFRAAAGTDVVCDILVLSKRLPGAEVRGESWMSLAPVVTADGEVAVNEYFATHPEMILGELRRVNGQYGEHDIDVIADPGKTIEAAITTLVAGAVERGLTYQPGTAPELANHPPLAAAPAALSGEPAAGPAVSSTSASGTAPTSGPAGQLVRAPDTGAPDTERSTVRKEGSIVTSGVATFTQVRGGELEPFQAKPKSRAPELRALCRLRDTMADVLAIQSGTTDDGAFRSAQVLLNQRYDDYVARFGPISRFTTYETGRVDPDTGEPTIGRRNPELGGFRTDPDFPSLLALEVFDPETQTATKASIFSERVVGPREVKSHADSPEEAITICLDEQGTVILERVATLLAIDPADARARLATLVFDDPVSGELVPAARYLSGNVRAKLAEASLKVTDHPNLAVNVVALEGILPEDLAPEEIDARPGVTWIESSDVAAFVREVLGASQAAVEHVEVNATWTVSVPTWQKQSVAMTSNWGTDRADGVGLLTKSLNQTAVAVYDSDGDGGRVLNPEATLLAREKQQALSDRFSTWVWEDPVRAERLGRRYNELFNSVVLPTWDGSHQSLSGLSAAFSPHPHQLDAAWRSVQEPAVLLGHAVGAGKTATMVIAGMEMKRLGLVSKPAYVVPNHMLEQFSAELLQAYPLANILMATKEATSKDAMKEFVARCATGDWDAVVITHSAFERIRVSKDAEIAYREAQIAEYRAAQSQSKGEHGLSVKRLEADIIRLEERTKSIREDQRRLDGVTFEETGVDYVFIDEAHLFKNLSFPTRIQGIGGSGSKRATDLDLKLHLLRQRHGGRVATFATATFVSNSISELYVMQRYLQPAALKAAGIATFDAWAANFGRTVSALELAPDGGSYRMKDRFARFANVPELRAMFAEVADVRTAQQLDLPTPSLIGKRAEVVVVPPSVTLTTYVESLVARAEAVARGAVRPEEDNMLKITGDGRKAALDLRLVGLTPDPDGGKTTAAADRIVRIWNATKERPYAAMGERLGALQLVFCDLGTPRKEWNPYDELRAQLVERGMPATSVRFIHEARNDREKAEVFAQCRSGAISVLIGSTEKMGVGTNVQHRAVALHHLDCPWRPADIEQREGRILRQGNLNPDVEILRYVTESSFDVFMWGTVERKAAFIAQVTRGDTELSRQLDDVGEQSLSYGEVKALATGNPLIMEKAGVDSEVAKLERLAAAHASDQRRLTKTIASAGPATERLEHEINLLEAALERREDITGEAFTATVTGVTCDKRTEVGERIKAALSDARHRFGQSMTIGHLAGFDLAVAVKGDAGETELHLYFPEVPIRSVIIGAADIDQEHPSGLVTRLTNRLGDLDERLSNDVTELTSIRRDAFQADELLGKPFDQVGRLANLRARQAEITDALTPKPGEPEAVDNGASAGQPASASEREISVGGVELPEAATRRISDGLAADVVGGGGSSLDLDDDLDLERELADELSMTEAGR
jgi:N12 class adenine-specific DNA methylase